MLRRSLDAQDGEVYGFLLPPHHYHSHPHRVILVHHQWLEHVCSTCPSCRQRQWRKCLEHSRGHGSFFPSWPHETQVCIGSTFPTTFHVVQHRRAYRRWNLKPNTLKTCANSWEAQSKSIYIFLLFLEMMWLSYLNVTDTRLTSPHQSLASIPIPAINFHSLGTFSFQAGNGS